MHSGVVWFAFLSKFESLPSHPFFVVVLYIYSVFIPLNSPKMTVSLQPVTNLNNPNTTVKMIIF